VSSGLHSALRSGLSVFHNHKNHNTHPINIRFKNKQSIGNANLNHVSETILELFETVLKHKVYVLQNYIYIYINIIICRIYIILYIYIQFNII